MCQRLQRRKEKSISVLNPNPESESQIGITVCLKGRASHYITCYVMLCPTLLFRYDLLLMLMLILILNRRMLTTATLERRGCGKNRNEGKYCLMLLQLLLRYKLWRDCSSGQSWGNLVWLWYSNNKSPCATLGLLGASKHPVNYWLYRIQQHKLWDQMQTYIC